MDSGERIQSNTVVERLITLSETKHTTSIQEFATCLLVSREREAEKKMCVTGVNAPEKPFLSESELIRKD